MIKGNKRKCEEEWERMEKNSDRQREDREVPDMHWDGTLEGGSIENKKAKEVSSVLLCSHCPPCLSLLPWPKNMCLLEIFVVISCYL